MTAKKKRGRPTDYRPEYSEECPADERVAECKHVVCHMRDGRSKETFAARVGVDRDTLYNWASKHPDFFGAVKRGEVLSLLWWENFLQSGSGGQLKVVASEEYDKQGRVKSRKFRPARFQPVGAIFTMKNRFPTLYKDRIDVASSGSMHHTGLSPASDLLGKMTDEDLLAKAVALAKKLGIGIEKK